MNTEKKAKKYILAALIVVIVAAVWMFVSTTQADARWGQNKGYSGNCPQYCAEPGDCWKWQDENFFPEYSYKKEGYTNFQDWWNAVLTGREEWIGAADEVISQYGNYLTEEQKEQLYDLEKKATNGTNLTSIMNNGNLIKIIATDAKKKQEEEALQTAEANAAAAQYTYQNQGVSSYSSGGGYSGNGFKSQGVVNWNGTRYTWYSSNVLYHYRTPEWTVNSDGFYTNSDGYLICASNDYAQGTIVSTPWGDAIVADSGCASGTLDMYTQF